MSGDRIRPRIRTAAVVWGLLLAVLGAGLAWAALDPRRIVAVGLWLAKAGPGEIVTVLVVLLIAAGAAIVVGSLLSVVHRAQDRRRARQEAAPDPDPDDPMRE